MARQRGQHAHPYKKGPSWLVRWWEDVRAVDGHIERQRFTRRIGPAEGPGKLSKREATRLADELIFAKLDQVSLRPGSLATVEQFVEQRFEPQVASKRRSNHYRWVLDKHVLPMIGSRRLRDVRRDELQRLLLEKAETLSPQSVLHIRNAIHAIFKHAKRLEYFTGEYPTEFLELPVVEKNPRRELNFAQAQTLIQRMPSEGPYFWLPTLLVTLATVGLRIGEACGLRWKRLNLSGELVMVDGEPIPPYYLTVRENYVLYKGGYRYGKLKSAKSRRNIPLPAELVEALATLRERSPFNGPDDPVFAGTNGRPMNHRSVIGGVVKPAAAELGLGWVSWHCFRHSASSFGDQSGMSETERQHVLGHAHPEMTKHYTHAEESRVRDGLGKVAAKLLHQTPPKKGPDQAKVLPFPERKEA